MFNYYSHEKQTTKKLAEELKPNKAIMFKTREVLSRRYKNRINDTLLELNDNLVNFPLRSKSPESPSPELSVIRNYKSQTRDTHPLDPLPSPRLAFNLRPRNKSKEIQPHLKFKLIGTERLKESLVTQRKFIDTSIDLKTLSNDYTVSDTFRTTAGKSVYGYFHYKIHPKTFESIALNLHSSTRNASKQEIRNVNREHSLGCKENKSDALDKLSREEIIPITNRVLEKYGIWKGRSKSRTPVFDYK